MEKTSEKELSYNLWRHAFTGTDPQTGTKKTFFVEFFLCNPLLGRDKPVLGQSSFNKKEGNKPSYLMVKAGAWGRGGVQLHKFYGIHKLEYRQEEPFEITVGDCYLSEDATKGSVAVTPEDAKYYKEWMCGSGRMSWSIVMKKRGPRTLYKGEVLFEGVKYIVGAKDCYGYSCVRCGSGLSAVSVLIASCHMRSDISGKWMDSSLLESVAECRNQCTEKSLHTVMSLEGKRYEFDPGRFWSFCRTSFSCTQTPRQVQWHVEQRTLTRRIVMDLACDKKDMILSNYESTEGVRVHDRLWYGGTAVGKVSLYDMGKLVDRIKIMNSVCLYGEAKKKQ